MNIESIKRKVEDLDGKLPAFRRSEREDGYSDCINDVLEALSELEAEKPTCKSCEGWNNVCMPDNYPDYCHPLHPELCSGYEPMKAEKTTLRLLAGECIKCENYDYEKLHFKTECYGCNRFYPDLFTPRELH